MIEKNITDLKEAVYKRDTRLINDIEMVIATNIKEYLKERRKQFAFLLNQN